MTPQIPTITNNLPPLYSEIVPLTPDHHREKFFSATVDFRFAAATNSFALAVEEFGAAQRSYPILFTDTETPMPAAFVCVEAGKNPYIDAKGNWDPGLYIPAYVRRYPFVLVRANANSNEHALCFDLPAANVSDHGQAPLFKNGEQTDTAKAILEFCVEYEKSIEKTRRICTELKALDLFASPTIKISRNKKTIELKGFRTIDENKLRELPAETLHSLTKSGVMAAIYAHLFSLSQVGDLEGLGQSIDELTSEGLGSGTIAA